MTPETTLKTKPQTGDQNAPASFQQAQAGDHPNLSYLYGSIGIQAVAAAARYADVRTEPAAPRIDQRFVESAI